MKLKVRLMIAFMLCCAIAFANVYPQIAVSQWITRIVYSTQDFVQIRQLLTPEQPLQLAVFHDGQPMLKHFDTITQQKDGFLLTYKEPVTVYGAANGVVIYSAHTVHKGKAFIIAYDDGMTVHYEQVTTIHKLPYTAVIKGEEIATVEGQQLYIAVYKDGTALSQQEFIRWLHEI